MLISMLIFAGLLLRSLIVNDIGKETPADSSVNSPTALAPPRFFKPRWGKGVARANLPSLTDRQIADPPT